MKKKVQGRKQDHVSGAGTEEKLLTRKKPHNMQFFSKLISSNLKVALE